METKNCQNCKNEFTIEPNDFSFYEKIQVPPPTFCPECRLIRRMAWRNERCLYRRMCDLCNKNIIAMYHSDVLFPVYCRDCWFGDGWDPLSYGISFNLDRSFFEQYKEFSNTVPRLALWQRNAVNSDYSVMVAESKNVYLSASVIRESENVYYSKCVDKSRDVVDSLNVINDSDGLYENVEAQSNYNSQFLLLCRSVIDSYYLVDCINCSNCLLSYNLRNKEFCIFNQQYSREEYFKELEKFNLSTREGREILAGEFEKIKREAIYRFANITKSVDVTGNNLLNAKNSKNCFEAYNIEDSKYCFRDVSIKDCFDADFVLTSELMYEYTTGGKNDYNVKFSYSAMDSVRNADYTEFCRNSNNLFGCISLRNTENAILNKTYAPEDYIILREKIIKQMESMPFVDEQGIIYSYGEFFPIQISPWAYNETTAQEYVPISKETALQKGYIWHDQEAKNFSITIPHAKIPNDIRNVDEGILNEVLGCAHQGNCRQQCNLAFRITDYELQFYKKRNIPLPDLCPNCRHYERVKVMPELKLWNRVCMCDKINHDHQGECPNTFETSYAPERSEIVYCEKCYQQEVY